jgi:hypothetical protein
MTMAYDPHVEWAREDTAELTHRHGLRPIHGPLVEGDLCDVDMNGRYCHRPAALEFVDHHGSSWLACTSHAAQIIRFT